MATRIVFVGGVHGVGKTYFCENLVGRFDIEHVTASSLIGRHIKHSPSKTVSDIEKNQLILAEELSRYHTERRTILLDGHFCLLDSRSDVQDVPLETFKAMSPYAFVVLTGEPALISARLSNRDACSNSLELIARLQIREVARAHFLSQSLAVPVTVIEPMMDFEKSIEEVAAYL